MSFISLIFLWVFLKTAKREKQWHVFKLLNVLFVFSDHKGISVV